MISDLKTESRALLEKINMNAEEEKLIEELDSLVNFSTESSFWTSDLISQRLET